MHPIHVRILAIYMEDVAFEHLCPLAGLALASLSVLVLKCGGVEAEI